MIQKLKILGPYTPEHEGPFCTRDGKPARVICRDRDKVGQPIIALVSDGECEGIYTYTDDGKYWEFHITDLDLMNAEEVPSPRELWIVGNTACRTIEHAAVRGGHRLHLPAGAEIRKRQERHKGHLASHIRHRTGRAADMVF